MKTIYNRRKIVVTLATALMCASFSTVALADETPATTATETEVTTETTATESETTETTTTEETTTEEKTEVAEVKYIVLEDAINQALEKNASVLEAKNELEIATVELERTTKHVNDMKKMLNHPDVSQMNQDLYQALVLAPAMQQHAYDMAKDSLTLTEQSIKLAVISSYYAVLSDGKKEMSLLDAYYRAEVNYKAVMNKYAQGMTTKLETLSAEVELNSARSDLYGARNKTIQDKRSFNVLIGNDYEMNWSPAISLTFEELKIEDKQVAAAELVEKSMAPKLTYHAYEISLEQYKYDSYFYHEGTYNEKITTKTYENALIKYENTLNETKAKALASVENIDVVAEQYKIALASEDMLREVYRLSVLLYENGFNTQADVLKAEADLSAMESARLSALTGYNIMKTSMEYGIIQ